MDLILRPRNSPEKTLWLDLQPNGPFSSPAAAEMTKLLKNIYRCVNIALVNELKLLCLRMGIDILEVIEAACPNRRIPSVLPGTWFGRTLHPSDPFYLSWKAKDVGFPHALH